MKLRSAFACTVLAIVSIVGATHGLAQQAAAKRDFDGEIRSALQAAKDASEFEFLGTLARICLLPQSGGENMSDKPFPYVADPASAPARSTWYA